MKKANFGTSLLQAAAMCAVMVAASLFLSRLSGGSKEINDAQAVGHDFLNTYYTIDTKTITLWNDRQMVVTSGDLTMVQDRTEAFNKAFYNRFKETSNEKFFNTMIPNRFSSYLFQYAADNNSTLTPKKITLTSTSYNSSASTNNFEYTVTIAITCSNGKLTTVTDNGIMQLVFEDGKWKLCYLKISGSNFVLSHKKMTREPRTSPSFRGRILIKSIL